MLKKRLYVAACNYYSNTLGHEEFEGDVDYYWNICIACGYSEESLRKICRKAYEDDIREREGI